MTRAQAGERGLEAFVRPVIASARDLPRADAPIVRDSQNKLVVLIASKRDVEAHQHLREYLGSRVPRIAAVNPPPIATTYVGVPYFVANPDGLVVTNSLYCVRPRQILSNSEVLSLVARLNSAAAKLTKKPGLRYSPRSLEGLDF